MGKRTGPRAATQRTGKQSSQRSVSSTAAQRSSARIYLWCLLLGTATLALYSPVVAHPFINYDDRDYVTENHHVQAGLSAETIAWALTSSDQANWHPLTWLSHALDCELYGLNPHGHHLTSVLIHTANVLLLFLLLHWATGATGASAMVAALFALHPFNVESVAWVAERKNLLSTFFFLFALGAYGRYALQPNPRRYAAVAGFFLLGLAAKPMVITLPFVLLLLDYWPLARIQGWATPSPAFSAAQAPWPRLLLEKIPLLALSAASAAITVFAQHSSNAFESLGEIPIRLRLENAVYSYAKYVAKIFWPWNMALVYPHPLNQLSFFQVGSSAIFLVAMSVWVWRGRQRHPYAITGWLWFLGTLVPVIGLVQVGPQGMADRYAYISTIGIFVLLVWGFNDWASSRPEISNKLSSKLKPIAFAILAFLAVLSFRQIGYWRSSEELWTHTLQITEDNFIANDMLGSLLLKEGRLEGLQYFEAAARIAPSDPASHRAVGAALQDRGDLQGAIREYQIVLHARDPKLLAYTYANLGVIYRQLGNDAAARQNSDLALRSDPGTVRQMIQQLSGMVQARPTAPGYLRLGLLLQGANQTQDAKSAFARALQLDPGFAPARQALQNLPAQ
jgi:tetratricopeptide (TPR) repeat protein